MGSRVNPRHSNLLPERREQCSQNGTSLQRSYRTYPRAIKSRMSMRLAFFLIPLFFWHVVLFWSLPSGTSSEVNTISFFDGNDPSTPILMVGGSDGSGTRAFVETLRELGTIIVSEDRTTFDVHAAEIKEGWPGLIKRIFLPFGRKGFFSTESSSNHPLPSGTESHWVTNYDWPPPKLDFDEGYKSDTKKVEADIEKLIVSWNRQYKLELARKKRKNSGRAALVVGGTRTDTMYPNATASGVTYAVKAPISMLALPVFTTCYSSFLQKQWQKPRTLKFLHVIRDGRDVALSDNQSPVIKFYNLTYPKDMQQQESLQSKFPASLQLGNTDRMYAKAIQLWNDWNLVVHRWATNHNINDRSLNGRNDADSPMVDYLWVRSEDLLIPGSQKRLDALTAIAKFVGSSLTHEELCCLSRQDTKDHGRSQSHGVGASIKFKAPHRFGHGFLQSRLKPSPVGETFAEEYDIWKAFVQSALRMAKPANIQHLIERGEHFLTILSKKERTEILALIQKLKSKSGHRRLLALKQGPSDARNSKVKYIIKNQTHDHEVSNRYGKWQKFLENRTELSDYFHREAAEGLRVFGYHPYRTASYTQEYGGNNYTRDAVENVESSNTMSGDIYINKSGVYDEAADADDDMAPGICEISIACPG